MFRLYGIHDADAQADIPVAVEEVDREETSSSAFRKGKAVVRGRFEDYSRSKGYGVALFRYRTLEGEADNSAPCVPIEPEGSFCAELSLDHPLWADFSTGGYRPYIPFYVRPGDTLDITVKGIDEGKMSLEYATTHPGGCHERLLKHVAPVIYSDWEKNLSNLSAISDEDFFRMTEGPPGEEQ